MTSPMLGPSLCGHPCGNQTCNAPALQLTGAFFPLSPDPAAPQWVQAGRNRLQSLPTREKTMYKNIYVLTLSEQPSG